MSYKFLRVFQNMVEKVKAVGKYLVTGPTFSEIGLGACDVARFFGGKAVISHSNLHGTIIYSGQIKGLTFDDWSFTISVDPCQTETLGHRCLVQSRGSRTFSVVPAEITNIRIGPEGLEIIQSVPWSWHLHPPV